MASPKKRALGKGLDALLSGKKVKDGTSSKAGSDGASVSREDLPADSEVVLRIDPRAIEPNPQQPRTTFNEEALEELAASIKRDGVQEPVIVRKRGGKYELVSGERRVRASIMADIDTVPAICREISDNEMLRLGLIENIQREDLNAIELAEAYRRLIEEFDWTQEELSEQVGKKRATVTNILRLLNLPSDVQAAVAEGRISMGHARALLALDSPEAMSVACRKIIDQGLSVRQAEKLAAPPPAKPEKPSKDPHLTSLEDELRRSLGTRVVIRAQKDNRGAIEIEYYNLDDLERILDVLRG